MQANITNESNPGQSKNRMSKGYTYFLFLVILLMNMLINFDHGVMPAAAVAMKEDLVLNNTEYGWLGSVVFIGLTLGKCHLLVALLIRHSFVV